MSDLPDHDAFTRHVGETFVLRPVEGEPVEVELVEARAFAARATSDASVRRIPFSLLFRSQGPCALGQHTYRVEHDALGAMDLFLVPVGPDEVGMRFEAVFN